MDATIAGYGDFQIVEGGTEGIFGDMNYSLSNFVVMLIVAVLVLIFYAVMFTDYDFARQTRSFLGINGR